MFQVYHELPSGYQISSSIDMKDNKKEFILINSLVFIVLIPFYFGLAWMKASFTFTIIDFLFLVVFYILNIILHECVHAIFFKFKNHVKVQFKFHGFAASASLPNKFIQKKHYLIVTLAPFLFFDILYITLMFFTSEHWFYLLYILLAFHVSGCVGDLYVFLKLIGKPKDTLIEDYGVGMKFYNKNEATF